jgi:thiosulfate/3-mercaptopyruvate sulfurtransferase
MTRSIDPIVSTDWLEGQLGSDGLVIIDVRPTEQYEAGHIPGAISVPFSLISAWSDCGDLILQLPPEEDLFKTIGDCGITPDSRVVIVGSFPEPGVPPYALADAVRVAATLVYAGVKNVGVLAGTHAKWASEGRQITTEVPEITPVAYSSTVDSGSWVSTEYVMDHIGKSIIIDARDPDGYFGTSRDPFVDMAGHIPTARNLPLAWVWEADGTYRPTEFIEQMAAGVIGPDKEQEVICYCSAGGYSSAWWFLLTQMLGYKNAKLYDGSLEAWVDEKNPIVAFTWTE